MRFATFVHDGKRQPGVVTGDQVHPFEHPVELLDLVMEGEQSLRGTGERALTGSLPLPLADVRLLPPLRPPTVRDYMTFESHVAGIAQGYGDTVPDEWYEAPAFSFTNPYSVIGAHDDVPVPPGCARFDFELEVAAVIGKPGRDLTPEKAREHILGYTILNDWSARDLQGREMRVKLGPAKAKDTATTLGPWLVTADELEPHRNPEGFLDLALTVQVNGETVGEDRLANMAWTFEEMAACLPWHLDPPRRRPGLRNLRQRRLPGRTLGPRRHVRTPAARPRRHRHHDGRRHRHHQQHRHRGRRPGARAIRPPQAVTP